MLLSCRAKLPNRASNDVVSHVSARTEAEVARLIASLPDAVRKDLAGDLRKCGEAYGFDLKGESAYYLERRRTGLHAWTWHPLCSYDEIAELLSLVATLDRPLTERIANYLFMRAIQRNVASSPQVN